MVLSLIFAIILSSQPRAAVQPQADKVAYAAEVCGLLSLHAQRNSLPVDFFTRLIWKESIFDAQAVSPAGAEGIAQFMPGTAKLRGLKNSFDHREALAAAAEYLAFLTGKFGNLGLAAAAYNFGEDGTSAWLQNRRTLPAETEDYVLAITGHAAAEWRAPKTTFDIPGLGGSGSFTQTCAKLVLREMLPPSPVTRRSPTKPWGVVIAGGFSEARTLTTFERVKSRYAALLKDELPMVVRTRDLSRGRKLLVRVMIGRNTRQEAEALCARLRAQSGACIVDKN
ncbi:MAG TPA: transglycosylase SLT domain-containing protein [Aestuariivirga sp.]|nr:transglycosylase SLT domain-containing protein [Aestuariivirga sp.]